MLMEGAAFVGRNGAAEYKIDVKLPNVNVKSRRLVPATVSDYKLPAASNVQHHESTIH